MIGPKPMKQEPWKSTPYRLTPREREAELKELRALIARDFSASRMSNTRWRQLLWSLYGLPIRKRFKFIDVDTVFEGGLYPATDRYIEGCVGPVLTLSLEWLEINPMERVHRGELIAPEILDHTSEVEKVLQSLNIPYEWNEGWMRIIGHVRNP